MLFSEAFNIKGEKNCEWFDPIIHQDTELFIDPFLVFKTNDTLFKGVYDEMMQFFKIAFKLVAMSKGKKSSKEYINAINMFETHEVNEICLGYSPANRGSGFSKGWAEIIVENIEKAIKHNILELEHFEEISIFSKGIGPDYISDITANLMKDRLVLYTSNICKKYEIGLKKKKLKKHRFNWDTFEWIDEDVFLPIYEGNRKKAILLVPKKFLCEKPEINYNNFDYYLSKNEQLREKLNIEIGKNLSKKEIIEIVLENHSILKGYIKTIEKSEGNPYDLDEDILLRYRWYEKARDIVNENPLIINSPRNEREFRNFIGSFVSYFKDYIEQNLGYRSLWNEELSISKSENAVMLLFEGIIEQLAYKNNIDLERKEKQEYILTEFRFPTGKISATLIQAKLANNTKYWNSLYFHLDKYLKDTGNNYGVIAVIEYRENDSKRVKDIQNKISKYNKKKGMNIKLFIIHAMP